MNSKKILRQIRLELWYNLCDPLRKVEFPTKFGAPSGFQYFFGRKKIKQINLVLYATPSAIFLEQEEVEYGMIVRQCVYRRITQKQA